MSCPCTWPLTIFSAHVYDTIDVKQDIHVYTQWPQLPQQPKTQVHVCCTCIDTMALRLTYYRKSGQSVHALHTYICVQI